MSAGKLVQFYSTANVFLQIMVLLISNISLQECYSESFIANSYFPLKTQKFSPTDVFPYTVYRTIISILLSKTQLAL